MNQRIAALALLVGAALIAGATSTPVLAQGDADAVAPTFADVAYGPHERNKLDLWQAKSVQPTPLVIFIHGGGFVNGDKSQVRNRPVLKQCLDQGVSFASLNYRFREHAPIQDILRDAARAVQYIRSRAKEWNIDPQRIASFGSSAGAGTSLWLAFHDDLADPNAADPVLRESSRLAAAGALDGQASYDLRDWDAIVGPSPFQRSVLDRDRFYGFKSADEAQTPAGDKIMKDCSMINLITQDDPPVACACGRPNTPSQDRGHYVHHPKHAIAIADRCKAAGIDCRLILVDDPAPASRTSQQRQVVEFLIEKVKG